MEGLCFDRVFLVWFGVLVMVCFLLDELVRESGMGLLYFFVFVWMLESDFDIVCCWCFCVVGVGGDYGVVVGVIGSEVVIVDWFCVNGVCFECSFSCFLLLKFGVGGIGVCFGFESDIFCCGFCLFDFFFIGLGFLILMMDWMGKMWFVGFWVVFWLSWWFLDVFYDDMVVDMVVGDCVILFGMEVFVLIWVVLVVDDLVYIFFLLFMLVVILLSVGFLFFGVFFFGFMLGKMLLWDLVVLLLGLVFVVDWVI